MQSDMHRKKQNVFFCNMVLLLKHVCVVLIIKPVNKIKNKKHHLTKTKKEDGFTLIVPDQRSLLLHVT